MLIWIGDHPLAYDDGTDLDLPLWGATHLPEGMVRFRRGELYAGRCQAQLAYRRELLTLPETERIRPRTLQSPHQTLLHPTTLATTTAKMT